MGELYVCFKNFTHVIALISNNVLLKSAKPMHHWTPQLIRRMEICDQICKSPKYRISLNFQYKALNSMGK